MTPPRESGPLRTWILLPGAGLLVLALVAVGSGILEGDGSDESSDTSVERPRSPRPDDEDGRAGTTTGPATLRGPAAPRDENAEGESRDPAKRTESLTDGAETGVNLVDDGEDSEEDDGEDPPSAGDLPATPPTARVGTPARWMDDEPVYAVAFTPDARLVVSAGESSVLVARDVATGRVIERLEAPRTGGVSDLAISPDGRYVLSGGYDHTTRLWALGTGEVLQSLVAGSGTVYGVAFVPGGSLALAAGDLEAVILWDTSSKDVLKRFELPNTGGGACVSRDGRTLFGVSSTGLLRAWDFASGSVLWDKVAHKGSADEVQPVPGKDELVTCGEDGQLKVWAAADGKLIRAWKAHDERISEMAVSPDGRRVATGGWEGRVKHWRLDDGTLLWERAAHDALIVAMAYARDGRVIASGARDGATRLWDAKTGEPVTSEPDPSEGHTGAVTDIVFVEGTLVSAGVDGTIRIWNADALEWTRLLRHPAGALTSLAASPDDGSALAGGEGGLARLDVRAGQWVWSVEVEAPPPGVVAFDAGGSRALWLGRDGKGLRIHDAATGARLSTRPGAFRALAAAPAGGSLALGGDTRAVRLVDPDGRLQRTISLDVDTTAASLAFFPDGASILIGTGSGAARIRLSDASVPTHYHAGSRAVDVATTPDGRRVVLACANGQVCLFEAGSGEPRRRFVAHKSGATCVAVSPDGRRAASGGRDGAIYLWNLGD